MLPSDSTKKYLFDPTSTASPYFGENPNTRRVRTYVLHEGGQFTFDQHSQVLHFPTTLDVIPLCGRCILPYVHSTIKAFHEQPPWEDLKAKGVEIRHVWDKRAGPGKWAHGYWLHNETDPESDLVWYYDNDFFKKGWRPFAENAL